jgi:3,4-dihydroxy 2-butanone 4-phosphate synthase/GTP cyclohydrolase II
VTVEQAVAAIAAGKAVVLVDDDLDAGGDLVVAAALATPLLVGFVLRHTAGILSVPLTADECDRLDLPLMSPGDSDHTRVAYTVSVDAKDVTTGISAVERARTIRLLAQLGAQPDDFVRPGHVLPVRASQGGVLERAGRAEAAIDLARLAGLPPAGVLGGIISRQHDGDMARGGELRAFAEDHRLDLLAITDLVAYRRHTR